MGCAARDEVEWATGSMGSRVLYVLLGIMFIILMYFALDVGGALREVASRLTKPWHKSLLFRLLFLLLST